MSEQIKLADSGCWPRLGVRL